MGVIGHMAQVVCSNEERIGLACIVKQRRPTHQGVGGGVFDYRSGVFPYIGRCAKGCVGRSRPWLQCKEQYRQVRGGTEAGFGAHGFRRGAFRALALGALLRRR